MTQVLNKYLGAMVQEVLSYNGDILKFSGDAFLAVFKSSEDTTMRDSVHEALDCALVIQKSYGSYLTDVNVVIRGKTIVRYRSESSAIYSYNIYCSETSDLCWSGNLRVDRRTKHVPLRGSREAHMGR